jgi:microcystin degradation protein MlrC
VLVVTDGDGTLAEQECTRLSGEVWQRRRDYLGELVPLEDAVRQAHAHHGGLVVLSDCADATTSGAPGDSTWLLRELLRYDWPRPALVTLVAPDVVAEANRRGIGGTIEGPLGGVRDGRFSTPLPFRGQIAGLFEARFVMSGHLSRNLPIDMGPSAVLRSGNVHVVVTSRSGPHFAPQLFRAAGIDPFAASVLVAKSPCGFRAAYADQTDRILVVRAPGCAPADFWNYQYANRPRPLWPWEQIADWAPKPFSRGSASRG